MRHKALQKVWQDASGKRLVPDGSDEARLLIARKGQEMSAQELSRFSNAPEFFDGLAPAQATDSPAPETAKASAIELEDDEIAPSKPAPKKKGK